MHTWTSKHAPNMSRLKTSVLPEKFYQFILEFYFITFPFFLQCLNIFIKKEARLGRQRQADL